VSSPITPTAAELRSLVAERFDQHRDQSTATALPTLLAGFDPDSRATALCVAELDASENVYVITRVDGGGEPKVPLEWQGVFGCAALLDELRVGRAAREIVLAVETQGLGSQWTHDCAELLAWRWRLDTLAQLRRVRCEHVEPSVWMRGYVPEAFRKGQPKGTAKKLYQRKSKELVGPKLAKNEDRCAAIGIVWWLAARFGCELVAGPR
jgi:hypothetical protein